MWFKSNKEFTNYPLKVPQSHRQQHRTIIVILVSSVFAINFWNSYFKELIAKIESGELSGTCINFFRKEYFRSDVFLE